MKLDRAESNIIVKQKREIIGVQLNWNTNETKRNFKWLNWLRAMFGQMYFKGSLKDWIRSTITLHSARHNLNFKYADIFFSTLHVYLVIKDQLHIQTWLNLVNDYDCNLTCWLCEKRQNDWYNSYYLFSFLKMNHYFRNSVKIDDLKERERSQKFMRK